MDDDVSERRPHPGEALDSWDDLRTLSGEDEADRWAWLAEHRDDAATPDISGCTVTAVLVTLDAEAWLPETLAALSRLTHKPNRLIAVDNGSTDSTRELLERAQRHGVLDAVVAGPARGGFGAGVAAALAAEPTAPDSDGRAPGTDAAAQEPPPADPDHWLWLLHDDAVPSADTLQQLLAHVVTDPGVDITGPKLVFPRRRHGAGHQLSEVGVTIARTGRRHLGLDLGEIDQGQRDQPRQHLGVSTCGLLIRRRDWDALDGLDPDLPCFRDGVELGWRATARGLRVVTTPQAQMVHRQVGRAGLRPRGAGGRHPDRLDQQLGLLVVAGHAPTWRLPFTWLRLALDCLIRALGYLLGKAPARARDELATLGWLVGHSGRIRGYRRRLRRAATEQHRRIEGDRRTEKDRAALIASLRPPWWSGLRLAVESVTGTVSDRYRELAGDSEAATTLDELTGDDFATVARRPEPAPVAGPRGAHRRRARAGQPARRPHPPRPGSPRRPGPAARPGPARRAVAIGGHPDPRCSRGRSAALAGPDGARLHGAGRPARVAGLRLDPGRRPAGLPVGLPAAAGGSSRTGGSASSPRWRTRCCRCCWAGPTRAG